MVCNDYFADYIYIFMMKRKDMVLDIFLLNGRTTGRRTRLDIEDEDTEK